MTNAWTFEVGASLEPLSIGCIMYGN